MDGTEDTQDVNTSEDGQETSEREPETFTREDLNKARSDALADVGRIQAESKRAREAAEAAEKRLIDMLKQQEEDELNAVRDDPEALKSVKERQRQRVKETELAKRERELNEQAERYKTLEEKEVATTKERNAREYAKSRGLDPEPFIKFTDGSLEAMEALAPHVSKKEPRKPLVSDSGRTSGGGKGIPTKRDAFVRWVADLPPDEYEKLKPEIDEMRKKDLIK